MNPRLIQIGHGGKRAWVYPEHGFQLYGFEQDMGAAGTAAMVHEGDTLHEPADRRYGNPVLFPNPGAAVTSHGPDTWAWKEKILTMPFHGVARNLYWHVLEIGKEFVTGELVPNSSSLVAFPFPYRLRMTYRLDDRGLVLDAELENTGKEGFPYALGFHPYIRAPLGVRGRVADCSVALPPGVELKSQNGWETMTGQRFEAKRIRADEEIVTSIILAETKARHLELEDHANGLAARVSVEGSEKDFPVWVVWSESPQAQFVCLEPWTDGPNALNRRETRRCEPGQVHRYQMVISVRKIG